jgi:hypothetical protein
MEKKIYLCKTCGVSLNNRADWCDLGCGNDYNEMVEVKGLPELLNEIRLDTLRQVLPKEIDLDKNLPIGGDVGDGFFEFQRDIHYNEKVREIKNKAKEIWGLDLTN